MCYVDANSANVFINACTIGNVNFIVIKDIDNKFSEVMMSNEELIESSIKLIRPENCCEKMINYLKGL